MRALCLHGHFYQPPREHPWLGVVEPEPSAAPERDWNTRITAECYRPNATARVLDAHGRLEDLVDNYAWIGFDVGPTLLGWLAGNAPDVLAALRDADARSRARTGHGNAWAQAYAHPILPLSSPRDVHTQVRWGRREFEHRFGRLPDGMWLPEMAVDATTLVALAEAEIPLTMLSPHQARRVRPLGGDASAWRPVTAATLDTRRLYRCIPAPGLAVDVVFRDAGLSHDLAFEHLLGDGAALVSRLRAALAGGAGPALLTLAVDGETFGHHHRFGEMALAWALRALRDDPDVALVGPAAFRTQHPPTDEVEIAPNTSWSCPHGVERWRTDCGCTTGDGKGGTQAWRAPLRAAIDWLRDALAAVYEGSGGEVLRDPWGARDRYVDCVLEPARREAFVRAEARQPLSATTAVQARRVLELARHALLMQTSCGWFFDDLDRVEPALVLRHAARACELAAALGTDLEDELVERLAPARSSRSGESGAALYRRAVRPVAASAARVAATAGMLAVLGEDGSVPGHDVDLGAGPAGGALRARVRVVERVTGAETTVALAAARLPDGHAQATADDRPFTLADLFGVQRERLMAALAVRAAQAGRRSGRTALGDMRPALDLLLADGVVLPLEVATVLGWERADTIVAALEAGSRPAPLIPGTAELRRRGARFPVRWLGTHLTHALEEALGGPAGAAIDALALLDLAEAADVPLDLAQAQMLALLRRRAAPAGEADALAILAERLRLAPVEVRMEEGR